MIRKLFAFGSCTGTDTGTGFWKNSVDHQCFL